MKISFFPQSCVPYHANSLDEGPLGGTETGIIRLAQALHQRGHTVTVYTSDQNPPPSNPPYLPIRAVQSMQPVDVFVVVREWIPLVYQIPCRKRFFLTGDAYDQPHNLGIGDLRVAARIDGVLLQSEWHAATLCKSSGLPREKVYIIRNGVYLPFFEGAEERKRKRLIYSSTPYRGLEHLPRLYAEIKKRHPDAELHIFSGYDVYGKPSGSNTAMENRLQLLKEQLLKLPHVYFEGNVTQQRLAREFMKSAVLAYPNTFAETSCITAMEAQAAGCVPVSTALGGLPETVGDGGVLISGRPGTPEYDQQFVEAIDRIFSDDAYFEALSKRAWERGRALGWDGVAERFEKYLREVHSVV
ncbi:MAG: glycosyltransferase family 4 protein [Deltaproteobacteria bacterium]|nr:glycosyltransferase family 4 protein [Deltaproteobacteria bacterium]